MLNYNLSSLYYKNNNITNNHSKDFRLSTKKIKTEETIWKAYIVNDLKLDSE